MVPYGVEGRRSEGEGDGAGESKSERGGGTQLLQSSAEPKKMPKKG